MRETAAGLEPHLEPYPRPYLEPIYVFRATIRISIYIQKSNIFPLIKKKHVKKALFTGSESRATETGSRRDPVGLLNLGIPSRGMTKS
jgi:hypothetical protein